MLFLDVSLGCYERTNSVEGLDGRGKDSVGGRIWCKGELKEL